MRYYTVRACVCACARARSVRARVQRRCRVRECDRAAARAHTQLRFIARTCRGGGGGGGAVPVDSLWSLLSAIDIGDASDEPRFLVARPELPVVAAAAPEPVAGKKRKRAAAAAAAAAGSGSEGSESDGAPAGGAAATAARGGGAAGGGGGGAPKLEQYARHSRELGDAWMAFVAVPALATGGLLPEVLQALPEEVIPRIPNPLLLSDFLTDCYNMGALCECVRFAVAAVAGACVFVCVRACACCVFVRMCVRSRVCASA